MRKPLCMSGTEYARWLEAAEASWASSPCVDCLAGFALEMRQIGACDGRPGGQALSRRRDLSTVGVAAR